MPTNPTTIAPVPLHQIIINAACKYYEITEAQLKTREHVEKKKIVQYLLRTEADLKFKQIAKLLSPTASDSHNRPYENIQEIDARKNISRAIRTDLANIKTIAGICE